MQLQLPLHTPQDHAKALHPAGRGLVTLATPVNGRWREVHRVTVADLPHVVRHFAGAADIYLTQNRFHGRRRIAALAELGALFADLDFYQVDNLAHLKAGHVLELALQDLEAERIPAPSFAVGTGRGLALVWLHGPVPRAALPRWNACQRHIYEALKHLGADARAKDAARVLRLIGSKHSKTGVFVEALTPAAPAWPFDTLADEILPLTRAELIDLRTRRALRAAKAAPGGRQRPPQGFTPATLWEGRLSDLQRLLDMRFLGLLPPGQRNEWLFLAGVAMSWLAEPRVLHYELVYLARQVTGGAWDDRETKSRLHSVIARTKAAARGEAIEWPPGSGRMIDPRYHFRTSTIIERLNITPGEQEHMRVLIGSDLVRERHRLRMLKARREAGAVSRDEYLQQTEARRIEAHLLRREGLGAGEIAEALGVHRTTVWRYLQEVPEALAP